MMKGRILGRLFFVFIIALCAGASVQSSWATDEQSASPQTQAVHFNYGEFNLLPVMDGGRLKPLQSFAALKLEAFSGQDTFEGMSPEEWLALSLFDPARASDLKLFSVRNKNLRAQLGLDNDAGVRVSLGTLQGAISNLEDQIKPLLDRPAKDLNADQKALLDLYKNVRDYTNLIHSFSVFLPLNVRLPEGFRPAERFYDLFLQENFIQLSLKKIIDEKGTDPSVYSEDEQRLAAAGFLLMQMRMAGEANNAFAVLPVLREDGQHEWLSPWHSVLGPFRDQVDERLKAWERLSEAYRSGDVQGWDEALAALKAGYAGETAVNAQRFAAENFYRIYKPFRWVMGLYGLSFLLAFFYAVRPQVRYLQGSIGFGVFGAAVHGLSLLGRIYILGRPPVGTLYESVLFVSLISLGLGLLLSLKRRDGFGLMAGSAAAMALLFLAPLVAPQGDDLQVLVAVLNTDFWLATHVLCISMGYGVCLLAAGVAHTDLFMRAFRQDSLGLRLQELMYRISLAALLFTAVGTVLGGIWADQSWGRFWGWDPKENGALLIVLWLIWVLHGRYSGQLTQLGFAVTLALLNVVVALAWFGVNLLNVGLHSYGFTGGLALGLGIFCIAEFAVIGFMVLVILLRKKGAARAV